MLEMDLESRSMRLLSSRYSVPEAEEAPEPGEGGEFIWPGLAWLGS